MEHLPQILLLLGLAVVVVVLFHRLHAPTSLGYVLVGIVLGPHTAGPSVHVEEFEVLAEFGVVFLLFTIGLSFSLPQLHAMRHQVLGLGTAQVLLTTLVVGVIVWLGGLAPAAAFVVGIVFAQSSSTIIGSLLAEQGEESTPHGRLGLGISVFQDVTAVPALVILPVLGAAVAPAVLAGALGLALVKAVAAIAVVLVLGRWLMRPMFRQVTRRPSAEVFTLAVLLVVLLAAWSTHSLGLSLAFGAFLAGMTLGETEFRHQVESSIRPFRDVLLGLFFIGVGMLFDPAVLPAIWPWVLAGALLLVTVKTLLVAALVRLADIGAGTAWRTALLLAVGGEFGLALLAIALQNGVVSERLGQILLNAVLLSLVIGTLLIRFNGVIARRLVGAVPAPGPDLAGEIDRQVVIGGYGRVGHTIAVLMQVEGIPAIAFDRDPRRVEQGRAAGHRVFYGDISDPGLLSAIHVERASLVVISVDDAAMALRAVAALRERCPQVPVIARARDLETSTRLRDAGAAQALPEAIEASLRLGATALAMLRVPEARIDLLMQDVRDWDYRPVADLGPEPPADGERPPTA